jgi:hypothetical protein
MLVAFLFLTGCTSTPDTSSDSAEPLTAICDGPQGLEDLSDCVEDHATPADAGFQAPTTTERKAWEDMVANIVENGCDIELPQALAGRFHLSDLADSVGNAVCAVYEAAESNGDGKLDLGWGMFLVRPGADWNVDLQIPHPFDDLHTLQQGMELFSALPFRTLLVSASRRDADADPSVCQDDYSGSDPSHNTKNVFASTSAVIAGDTDAVLQLHGMADDSCDDLDVFVTEGVNAPLGVSSIAKRIQNAIASLTNWNAAAPDESTCDLEGATDVPGRILNGVSESEACDDEADEATGLFVHIEQKLDVRESGLWTSVMEAALGS